MLLNAEKIGQVGGTIISEVISAYHVQSYQKDYQPLSLDKGRDKTEGKESIRASISSVMCRGWWVFCLEASISTSTFLTLSRFEFLGSVSTPPTEVVLPDKLSSSAFCRHET